MPCIPVRFERNVESLPTIENMDKPMYFLVKPLLLTLYFFIFGLFFAAFQFYILYQPAISQDYYQLLLTPAAFTYVIADFVLLAIVVVWLSGSSWFPKVIAYTLTILVCLIESTQFLSLYFSQGFLNTGILENAELFTLMITPFTTVITLVPILVLTIGLHYFRSWLELHSLSKHERHRGSPVLLLLLMISMVLNNNVLAMRNAKVTYKAGLKPPLFSFIGSLSESVDQYSLPPQPVVLTAKDITIARKYGFHYDSDRVKPFQKATSFDQIAPGLGAVSRPLNVIVIFAESLSARLSGVYRPELKQLTPNMIEFANHGMVFRNYFNHVTPTIVGVRGQLCSIFPYLQNRAWSNTVFRPDIGNITCLPHILNSAGYQTYFFGYPHPESTFFEYQMKSSGFGNTLFFQDFLNRLVSENERPERQRQGNSDRQMFTGLVNFLKISTPEQPHFVAMSTLGTHPSLELLDSQTRHPMEKNLKLNLIYNLDRQFGVFWEYFKSSPWYDNTIVILTADHAHTASIPFKEIAGPDYKNENFDRVSLLIYLPGQPASESDVYSSSVDLAPSILQMLNIQSVDNSFMGRSIFGDRQLSDVATGLIYNKRLFLASATRYVAESNLQETCIETYLENEAPEYCAIYRLIKQSHYLQDQNRF
jgi:glucan phosphoethanolaminetransferase (alkaline phosphatase superfamily)